MPAQPPRRKRLIVPPEGEGERLDRFLSSTCSLSRSRLQRLIREGHVWVDGRGRKSSFSLSGGATVEIELPPPSPSHIRPQAIPLEILHEDDALIVVNKPAGLVVHPGAGNPDHTLVNALVHHCPDIEGVGGVRRPGLVQRLDKNTSGVLVVAKTEAAFRSLVEAMRRREIVRRYRGLVWGEVPDSGVIELPIGRDPKRRQRMAVRAEGGRPALTAYRTLSRFDFLSYLELTLLTGRTHQIRVHLSHQDHPVFGDPTYGGRSRPLRSLPVAARRVARELLGQIRRQALHAWRLEFKHPVGGEALSLEAPLPRDFARVLAVLESRKKAQSLPRRLG